MHQIEKKFFVHAVADLGFDTGVLEQQKLTVPEMSEIYSINEDLLVEAISIGALSASFDYDLSEVLISSLDAAYFYYCVLSSKDYLK